MSSAVAGRCIAIPRVLVQRDARGWPARVQTRTRDHGRRHTRQKRSHRPGARPRVPRPKTRLRSRRTHADHRQRQLTARAPIHLRAAATRQRIRCGPLCGPTRSRRQRIPADVSGRWTGLEGHRNPACELGFRVFMRTGATGLEPATPRRRRGLVETAPTSSSAVQRGHHSRRRTYGAPLPTHGKLRMRSGPKKQLPLLDPIGLHECRHLCDSHARGRDPLERIGDYVGTAAPYMTDRYRHLLKGRSGGGTEVRRVPRPCRHRERRLEQLDS